MNHISSFCASEASAKMSFNVYFGFMYGFKTDLLEQLATLIEPKKNS
ncbi:MAG: hypothetical protein U5L45_23740 [Saprospiraceae bacterium]|nr:hypothetical protein [Saprospiraceae bacterium]